MIIIYCSIITFLLVVLTVLTYKNRLVEGFQNSASTSAVTTDEAIANVASLYNEEQMTISNLRVTHGLTVDQTFNMLPVGSIIMWYGNSANIPQGWALCDGQVHTKVAGGTITTPNLNNDKFIRGVNNNSTSTGTTGNKAFSATTASAGAHAHRFPSSWYKRDFDDGDYSGIDTRGAAAQNQYTRSAGAHTHGITSVTTLIPDYNYVVFIMKL
jgi:hypothetical protein